MTPIKLPWIEKFLCVNAKLSNTNFKFYEDERISFILVLFEYSAERSVVSLAKFEVVNAMHGLVQYYAFTRKIHALFVHIQLYKF
jgi:hypothetical protein